MKLAIRFWNFKLHFLEKSSRRAKNEQNIVNSELLFGSADENSQRKIISIDNF